MKVNLVKQYGQIIAHSDDDYEKIKLIPNNKPFSVSVNFIRDPDTHRRYFAFINVLWNYLSEKEQEQYKSSEKLRKSMQMRAGYYDSMIDIKNNNELFFPKSIAFEKLSEIEFKQLFYKVREIAYEKFLSKLSDIDFYNGFDNFYK